MAAYKPNRRLILVDDEKKLSRELKDQFSNIFKKEYLAQLTDGSKPISEEDLDLLQSYSPEIVTCQSLEEIPEKVIPNPNTTNFWILDQMLGKFNPQTKKEKTSELVYLMMGVVVGTNGKPLAEQVKSNEYGDVLNMLQDEVEDVLTQSPGEVVDTLNDLHQNTGMMIGYSSKVHEIFTFNTEMVFSLLGDPKVTVSSPLVLFQEKNNTQQDALKMAQAYLLSAIAYGDKLPWNGVPLDSTEETRTTLPKDMHAQFSTASRDSGNTLEGFLNIYGKRFS